MLEWAEFQSAPGTLIINNLLAGDQQASDELLPMLYSQLRNLAYSLMTDSPAGNTLQPTALVHEAYLRLNPELPHGWDSRGHFYAAAAQAMRNILVDQARRKKAVRHGSQLRRSGIEPDEIAFDTGDVDILDLNKALQDLEALDERMAKVVMLRFFTGLSIPETAQAMEISTPTVQRIWRTARAFLFTQMEDSPDSLLENPHEL